LKTKLKKGRGKMKGKMVASLLFITIICFTLLSSCCSIPYKVNTRQVAKAERVEIHARKAEIVSVDGKKVSINKVAWFLPAHAEITKGKHDIVVNYWERSVIGKSPKKLSFNAEPGKKYYVQCSKKRAGKASDQKSRDDKKYLRTRKGGDYYTDKAGYLYTYECCIKDKDTNETLSCK
jgi:hypothetical protein